MNNEAVYRTAPATPGPLKTLFINPFIETQTQELSKEKSEVVHISRKNYTVPCPTLKVHNDASAKYLGNFITKKLDSSN